MIPDEILDCVDENDNSIGRAFRSECHGDPKKIHRAVHVLVFNKKGDLLLQKRAFGKKIQPGKWDSSVGGHLGQGESYESAAEREMQEEIGISSEGELRFLFSGRIRNSIESENIKVYSLVREGPFSPDPEEIEELRFWTPEEIKGALGRGLFTPNLEEEIRGIKDCPLFTVAADSPK